MSWEFVLGMELVGLRSNHTARVRSREVRSFLALEMAAREMLLHVRLELATSFARLHFASCVLRTCVFFLAKVSRRATNIISQIRKSIFRKCGIHVIRNSEVGGVSMHDSRFMNPIHVSAPPIPPKNPIVDISMNGTGSGSCEWNGIGILRTIRSL